jgi:Carboxypeptidase regulatory-like domain
MSSRATRWLPCLCIGLLFGFTSSLALAQPQTLRGQVVTEKNVPIPNAFCSLTGHLLPAQGLQTTTDPRGNFNFPALMPGVYSLTCGALGRSPISKPNIEVALGKSIPKLRIVLQREVYRFTVHGHILGATLKQSAPPTTVSARELMTLPLAQMKFTAALPLVPGVVRTPDGKLNIKGTPEEQGLLEVDGTDLVDPVTGAFSVEVPIDAIEDLQVYKAPYLVQYGRFSGGLTLIQSKPPLNDWHWELNDIVPDIFIEQGHIQGISGDAPRLYVTGPLIKNRLTFAESFIYDLSRNFTEGLPWPHNLTRDEGVSSFTTFQYIFSPNHLTSFNVRVFPMRKEFEDISALIPQSASSNYGQRGYSIGGEDHYVFRSGGMLTSLFQETEFDTYARGQGMQPILITPKGFGGNYFNSYQRFAAQQELLETYTFPQKRKLGTHNFLFGGDFFHRAYSGISTSQPELITTANGALLERIDFSGPANLSDEDTEFEGFGQDDWLLNQSLSFDYGLRFSSESIGNTAEFAPRFGFVYSPTHTGSTVIRGGEGLFYNREALLAADYIENPTRTMTFYSPQGLPLGPPQVWTN